MTHPAYRSTDWDMNWKTRLDAQAASLAFRRARESRNQQVADMWATAFAIVGAGASLYILAKGFAELFRSGLLSF